MTSQKSLVDENYLSESGEKYVVNLQHLFDRMAVCVVTSSGDIILWYTSTDEVS